MKILITGGDGQLGNELAGILRIGKSEIGGIPALYAGAEAAAVDVEAFDISDAGAAKAYVASAAPDLILNCAAMTNVDACESNWETAMRVNAAGARNMAAAADSVGAKIVHVSTDYVFDGRADTPYTEWDAPSPATVYGKSKLLGERYVRETCKQSFVVRTSWLYGYAGNNFVKTILGLARKNESIKVVSDQVGNPTHANDLAHHILEIAATEEYGIYHCTGNGVCSWHDLAQEAVRLAGISCAVNPCTTEEFPRPAPRPAYSAMEHLMLRCTTGDRMRPWREALAAFIGNWAE
jgi:dTDP-4-dehydrorhamnose reductase